MKNISLIVGARPNFIKAFPLLNLLKQSSKYNVRLINTGQHYDDNMAGIFFKELKINKPDIDLNVGSGTHAEQTAKIMIELEKKFLSERPELVIVFGDVNSTLAAALVASKLHILIAHVESGLRSFDRKMPEEINRIVTDQLSDILFTTSPEAKVNLINEGKDHNQIFFVGNTMIDSLINFKQFFNCDDILSKQKINKNEYALVTIHRPSNVDILKNLKSFINALDKISNEIPIIWPIHPRTKKKLYEFKIEISDNIFIIPPQGYLQFMGLQQESKIIITDSGGVQEESTFFGVPCFTVRDNTERPITEKKGSNTLVGSNFNDLPNVVFNKMNDNNAYSVPELWDGNASKRILEIIDEYL